MRILNYEITIHKDVIHRYTGIITLLLVFFGMGLTLYLIEITYLDLTYVEHFESTIHYSILSVSSVTVVLLPLLVYIDFKFKQRCLGILLMVLALLLFSAISYLLCAHYWFMKRISSNMLNEILKVVDYDVFYHQFFLTKPESKPDTTKYRLPREPRDSIQTLFKCCGVDSSIEYIHLNNKLWYDFPQSCCTNDKYNPKSRDQKQWVYASCSPYTTACRDAVEAKFKEPSTVMTYLIMFLLVMLYGLLAGYFINKIRVYCLRKSKK